jgi:uncharacterized protein (TIGR03118 family)
MPIADFFGKLVSRRSKQSALASLALFATVLSLTAVAQTGGAYKVTNLVSDGSVTATVTDTNFINPWAISASGTWWISAAGTGYDYVISSTTGAISFKVIVPTGAAPNTANGFPSGSVTTGGTAGMVLPNGTKASFLFSTLDGTISGWNSKLGMANAISQVAINNSSTGASYTGLAIINTATASYILAPNFNSGRIEIYDSTFKSATLTGSFTDPGLPSGYSPFSVHVLNNQVYVAYAVRTATAPFHTVDALGNGLVDVFDASGNFVARVATGGNLDSPWGVAFAPANFGIFGGSLLIGNFANGMINAYAPTAPYAYRGQLTDGTGKPLTYASLWELLAGGTAVGNTTAVSGGDPNSVFFTAGLAGENHGLFAQISNVTTTGTPSYGVSATAPALTVTDGSSVQTTINIAPTYSFSGTVSFACSGLPVAATCAFSPSQVSAVANAPASTTVTIHTAKFTAAVQPMSHGVSRILFAFLLPFVSIPAFYRRRSPHQTGLLRLALLSGVAFASLAAAVGCGNVPLPASTPTGGSQVMVTATSGSVTQSTTIALTVQ